MIIGIAGEAGSGKGTAAEVLLRNGYTKGKFAGALKDMLRALLRYRKVSDVDIERMIEGDLKELPHPALNGRSPRYAMQSLGTEWGRDCIDENLWVDTEFDALDGVENITFDDVRHENEEDAIVRRGGIIVQILGRRKGIGDKHDSESFQPKNPVLIDNSGSVSQLEVRIGTLVRDLSWAQVA